MNEKLAGDLFEKYYMKNGLWRERLQEVKEKGFDNASPIARLIYSCEIGEINQHASEDLKMISAALCVGYDLEQELKLRAGSSLDLDKWDICPKPNHGGYEILHGCRSCKLERVQFTIDAWRTAKQSKSLNWCADEMEAALSPEAVTE